MPFHIQQRVRVVSGSPDYVDHHGVITGYDIVHEKKIWWVRLDGVDPTEGGRWFYQHEIEPEND